MIRLLIALLLVGCATSRQDDAPAPDAGKQELPRSDGAIALTPDAAPGAPDAAPGAPDAAPQPDSSLPRDGAVLADAAPPRDAAPQVDASLPIDAAVTGGCTQLPSSGTATIAGATSAASPTWARPLANTCPASDVSAVGTAVPYQVQVFCNGGAARSFDIAMDGVDEVATLTHTDPYLVIYSGAGIPANALMCAAGNDDASAISAGSLVASLSVPAGGQIAVVATGFENTDLGTYQLRITAR